MTEASRPAPEEWRPVVGYEGIYEVSDLGRVRSSRGVRKLERHQQGYLAIQLYCRMAREHALVHRLVAAAFCDQPEGADIVRHLDGCKTHNVPSNLAWGTPSENNYDSVRHGTHGNSRKTHCAQGHELNEQNTTYSRRGKRACRVCNRASRRRSDARRRLARRTAEQIIRA